MEFGNGEAARMTTVSEPEINGHEKGDEEEVQREVSEDSDEEAGGGKRRRRRGPSRK